MGKQKLSPKAAKAKAVRDLACANTDDRKAKRADSQMKTISSHASSSISSHRWSGFEFVLIFFNCHS